MIVCWLPCGHVYWPLWLSVCWPPYCHVSTDHYDCLLTSKFYFYWLPDKHVCWPCYIVMSDGHCMTVFGRENIKVTLWLFLSLFSKLPLVKRNLLDALDTAYSTFLKWTLWLCNTVIELDGNTFDEEVNQSTLSQQCNWHVYHVLQKSCVTAVQSKLKAIMALGWRLHKLREPLSNPLAYILCLN